eukprot:TCONS_00005508-protein
MDKLSKILKNGKKLPEMVVFDLDETLWPFWCISHVEKPIKKCDKTGRVTGNDGKIVSLYQGAYDLIHNLHNHGFTLGIASKTPVGNFAKEVLHALEIRDFFTYDVMAPRCKKFHFDELSKQSAVHYKDMLFFDDNPGNIYDINSLGVTCVHVEKGLTIEDVLNGFQKFQDKHS